MNYPQWNYSYFAAPSQRRLFKIAHFEPGEFPYGSVQKGKEFAVIPVAALQKLMEDAEMLADVKSVRSGAPPVISESTVSVIEGAPL